MKFKTIFVIFNCVIIFSFLFIFFMPLILLGSEYFSLFATKNWIAAVLFLLTLIIINTYFISNWKLFGLLENEDWTRLMSYLEDRIFGKGVLRANHIKMLINACLITSNTQKITNLETYLAEKKPALVNRFALQLGIPHLLKNDPEKAEKYFGRLLAEPHVRNRGWIRWNYAFCLMQQKQFDSAKEELLKLLDGERDQLLQLLAIYMLDSFSRMDPSVRERVNQGRTGLQAKYSPEQWKKKVDGSSKNMEVIILAQIIRDAGEWLFKPEAGSEDQGEKIIH